MRSILFVLTVVVLPLTTCGLPTQCCICDDFSADPAKRCESTGVCENTYSVCKEEYCETTQQYINSKWYKTRKCAAEMTCINHWYHTVTTLGCVDNTRGDPDNGTVCYKCCTIPQSNQPHFCLDNPDTNYVTFPVTTPIPTTTSTTATTTTRQTTTTTQTTTPAVTGTTGTVCEVGRDGNYSTQTCDPSTPQCMNTVVLQTNLTIIKKTCESDILCDEDWLKLTRARNECMTSDFTSLPVRKEGLVCHYCCKSSNGSPCNADVIPNEVQQMVSRVDGGWSTWTMWQDGCTDECKGIRTRIRTCSQPFPGPNGKLCQGQSFETEACDPNSNCKITGSGTQAIVG